jgi:NAD(P)-dependent dehydrogenase (short-subunit alcohol dehydrogenase family)
MSTFAAENSFYNRTNLVTGGAGTLGRPLCIALARAGANVIVNDLGSSPHHQTASASTQHNLAEELAAEIKSSGFSAIASTHDVVDSAADIVNLAITTFGKIDAIINCVRIHPYFPFEDQGKEICQKVFGTNVLGPMQVVRAAWPHFKAQKYGRVVFCTSASVFGMENSAAYIASKGALLGLTKSLAFEGNEHRILSNAIAPAASPPMVMSAFEILPAEQRVVRNDFQAREQYTRDYGTG